MIRVLIVEDQRMAREDMENYIQSSGRYCLAASITNAAMAETVCRQSRCELVLMDVCTENDKKEIKTHHGHGRESLLNLYWQSRW